MAADLWAAAPFIDGLTVPPRLDRITQAGIAGTVEDIVTAAGGIFTSIVLQVSGSPITLYILGEGEKAKSVAVIFS